MTPEARAHLKQLLDGQRVLSLAVLIGGEPHIGLLPFVPSPDHTGVLVHASTLARHTKGLHDPGRFSVLIHQSEEALSDPLQVPRVSFQGEAKGIERDTEEYEKAKRQFLARFPEANVTFDLADFQLFELRFLSGRYIEGFASAMNVTIEDLKAL